MAWLVGKRSNNNDHSDLRRIMVMAVLDPVIAKKCCWQGWSFSHFSLDGSFSFLKMMSN
jgi:hypothetical protein